MTSRLPVCLLPVYLSYYKCTVLPARQSQPLLLRQFAASCHSKCWERILEASTYCQHLKPHQKGFICLPTLQLVNLCGLLIAIHSSSTTIPTLSPLLNAPLCWTLSCHCHSAFTCLLCEYWAGRARSRTLEIRVQGAWTHPSGGIPQVLFWQWDRKEGACCLGQMRVRAQLHRRWS